MYAPQELPAVLLFVLPFHVIAAVFGFRSPLYVPAFSLCVVLPEPLYYAFFLRRLFPFGVRLFSHLPLPCGEVAVVLLHKSGGFIIHLPECLHIGIALFFYNIGYTFKSVVDLFLDTLSFLGKGFALFAFRMMFRNSPGSQPCFWTDREASL